METTSDFQIEQSELADCYRSAAAANGSKEVLAAIHRALNVGRIVWDNRLSRTESAFTQEILHQIAYKEMQTLLGNVRDMRVAEYARNDSLRSKGVPYAERVKQFNRRKIEWCDQEEAKIMRTMESFHVMPLREWFDEVDYESAKRMGMRWVVRHRLDFIIK